MKKLILSICIQAATVFAFAQQQEIDFLPYNDDFNFEYQGASNIEQRKMAIMNQCKVQMRPYKVNVSKPIKVYFKEFEDIKIITLPPVEEGMQYKFMFNTDEIPQPVTIKLMNGKAKTGEGTVLFEVSGMGKTEAFEAPLEQEYDELFIQLNTPAKNAEIGTQQYGYVFFFQGYKMVIDAAASNKKGNKK
jgi:hypothetical protein